MPFANAQDGTELFYKDWGSGRPIVLIHGYPLTADSFDETAIKLVEAGFRVVNYDRRGFGRSGQPWSGYDWDTYADDLAAVMQASGAIEDVTVIGYSMGGGECARYMRRHGGAGIRSLGLYASIVPGMFRSAENPAGHTEEDYQAIITGIFSDAPAYFRNAFLPPFYGQAGAARHAASDEIVAAATAWAMSGSMRAQTAMPHNFTFGDFSDDIPAITVPTLILHGTDDKPAPIDATARRAAKLIPGSRLIEYEGHPHGFYATNSDQMISDTLDFVSQ